MPYLAVVTVPKGGMAVVDVTATKPALGMVVAEAANGHGLAVTKVAQFGVPVTFGVSVPVNTTLPRITGTPQVGQTLNVVNGVWTGIAPIVLTHTWYNQNFDQLGTGSSYLVAANQVGNTLLVLERATNAAGNRTAQTAPTAPVAP